MKKHSKIDTNITAVNVGNIQLVTDGGFSIFRTNDQFVLAIENDILGPYPVTYAKWIRYVFQLKSILSKHEIIEIDKMIKEKRIKEVEDFLKSKVMNV